MQYRDDKGNLSPVYCGDVIDVCFGTTTPTASTTLPAADLELRGADALYVALADPWARRW